MLQSAQAVVILLLVIIRLFYRSPYNNEMKVTSIIMILPWLDSGQSLQSSSTFITLEKETHLMSLMSSVALALERPSLLAKFATCGCWNDS